MSQGRYVSGELVRSVYVVNMSSGGGSGTPGGSNTQIQFNNAGVFGGVANSSVNNATGNITLGNRVSVPLGTAALPSIYPGTDTNTGIYSPGADQLAVATNGTGRLFINATGKVGIGTTSTGEALQVAGNIQVQANGYVNAGSSAAEISLFAGGINVGSNRGGQIDLVGGNASSDTGIIRFRTGTGAGGTAQSERARIDSSGRLLVGTSSARAITGLVQKIQTEDATGSGSGRIAIGTNNNLNNTGPGIFFFRSRGGALGSNTIVQNDDLVGSLFFQGADGTDINSRAAEISAVIDGTPGANDMPGCLVFSTTADGASSPTERLRINSSGNVGIGTSLPGATLEVAGSARFFGGSGTDGLLTIGSTGASNDAVIIKYDNANDRLQFYNWGASGSNQNTFVIDNANSRVGINTASPANLLDVASAQGDGIRIGSSPAGTITRESEGLRITGVSTNKNISFVTAGTEACRIDTSGRLLVGTSSARTTLFNTAIAPPIQVEGTGLGDRFLAAISSSSTGSRGGGVVVAHQKSGTLNGNTALAEQDSAGLVSFQGNDATNFIEAARIEVFVDGTPGTNDMPGRLVFSTTADGASSPTERLHINSVGQTMVNSAGTAAAPVISKVDDTNTGIFFPAADTIAFAEGGVERARIDSSGRLLVGTSTSTSVGGSAATVQILGTGGNPHSLQLTRGDAPVLVFGKTDVGGGANCLGAVVFAGNDTNDLNSVGATIGAFVDGTIGVDDLPTRLVFSTTSDSASSPTERMRITSDAYVRLAAGTGGIQFNGDTAAANALDDYEEGTWTPVITTDGGGATSNITTTGTYRKIGNVITCYVTINFGASSTIGVSTTFRMSLPFAASVGGSMAISQTSTVGILTSGYISGTMRATRASDGGSAQAYRGSFSYI
jgi:hypothetical protein